MKVGGIDILTTSELYLLNMAEVASENAYNPYSGFSVGAALLCHGGIITGSNVENAAYGSCICAERAAIMSANDKGFRIFSAIAIFGKGKEADSLEPVGPCGSCRQMIFELTQISGHNLRVIMSNSKKDKVAIATITELLPFAFGPMDLGIDISRFQK